MDFASWVVERIALNVRVLNQLFRGCSPGRVGRVALALGFLALIPRGAEAASVSIRQAGTLLTTISANAGDLIDLELVVDTGGLTLEGYSIGIDFTGGNVDILGVTHQSVGVLFPDLFGPLSIDNVANTIRNINQANFSG